MISLLSNRPVLQVGRHQVFEYDTAWLEAAIRRAATAAGCENFPFVHEIRQGIEQYLEFKCTLKLLPITELFDRMRRMLDKIGCDNIANKLEPLAPPLTVSLVHAAQEAGSGFELAFFNCLRRELDELRDLGAEEVRFTGLRECVSLLRGSERWDKQCDALFQEIRAFLSGCDREEPHSRRRPMHCKVQGESRSA